MIPLVELDARRASARHPGEPDPGEDPPPLGAGAQLMLPAAFARGIDLDDADEVRARSASPSPTGSPGSRGWRAPGPGA